MNSEPLTDRQRNLALRNNHEYKVAVILPCYNEEFAIEQTIRDFKEALPNAKIYVYDNNSTDNTVQVAKNAGAIVKSETRQGKGYVVRRMFADIEAEIYVLADGDSTYDARSAPAMIEILISDEVDMVVGVRETNIEGAYRRGHKFGNYALTTLLSMIFGASFRDILSGYRVFSRRFVKTFPIISKGFEIETEISVHALELDLPISELITPYKERPEGSVSKLSTYRDGFKILFAIMRLLRIEKPIVFFGGIAACTIAIVIGLLIPIIIEFFDTGLVRRLPTFVLCIGLTIIAILSLVSGIILSTVVHGRQEVRRLAYLSFKGLK